jgi:multidrug efflux pump subunit AcrA (membrane-fusion protein)
MTNKRQRILGIGVAALAAIGAANYVGASNGRQFAGAVATNSLTALNFTDLGRIATINVAPGQLVSAGTVLATQDRSGASAVVAAERTAVSADQTQLAQLRGTPSTVVLQGLQTQLASDTTAFRNDCGGTIPAPIPGSTISTDPQLYRCQTLQHQVQDDQVQLSREQGVTSTPSAGSDVAAAQAQLARDQAMLATNQHALDLLTLVAPAAGRVVSTTGSIGELADASGPRSYDASQPNTDQSSPGLSLLPPPAQSSVTGAQAPRAPIVALDTGVPQQITIQVSQDKLTVFHPGTTGKVTPTNIRSRAIPVHLVRIDEAVVRKQGGTAFQVIFAADHLMPPDILPGMTIDLRLDEAQRVSR